MQNNTFVVEVDGKTKLVQIRDLTPPELTALITDNSYETKDVDETVDGLSLLVKAAKNWQKIKYYPKGIGAISLPDPEQISITLNAHNTMATVTVHVKINSATGSGNYKLQARGSNLGTAWVDIDSEAGKPTSGEFDLYDIAIDGMPFVAGNIYGFRIVDTGTGYEGPTVYYTMPSGVGASIDTYSSGVATIDFDNYTPGDNWRATLHIAPDSFDSPSGASITGMHVSISFQAEGGPGITSLADLDSATDYTMDLNANGAGFYLLIAKYLLDDATQFNSQRAIRVDAAGNILSEMHCHGLVVNSTAGLSMNATANFTATGVMATLKWVSVNGASDFTLLGTADNPADLILPSDAVKVLYFFDFDADPEWINFAPDFFIGCSVSIS